MKDTFSFFNMKGILRNLTGCYCLVLKWWQEGKKALTAHSPYPSGTILVSSGKKMEFLTTGSHGTVTQNKNLGGICCLLQPLHENCFRNQGAGDDPWWEKWAQLWFTEVSQAKHSENQTPRIASHTENTKSKKRGLWGISRGHLVWPLLQSRINAP